MKTILKLLLGCLLFIQASRAQSIALNTKDPETGDRFILTSNKKGPDADVDDSVARAGIVLFAVGYQADKDGKLPIYFIDLNIVHNDNRTGCLKEKESLLELTLSDDTKISCMQISETDCGLGAFKGVFALMPKGGTAQDMQSNFEKLLKADIREMELTTSEKTLKYKTKSDSREYIKKHFALLASTIKTTAK
jgi:hypothetical protein